MYGIVSLALNKSSASISLALEGALEKGEFKTPYSIHLWAGIWLDFFLKETVQLSDLVKSSLLQIVTQTATSNLEI